jgi:hypothetical protein
MKAASQVSSSITSGIGLLRGGGGITTTKRLRAGVAESLARISLSLWISTVSFLSYSGGSKVLRLKFRFISRLKVVKIAVNANCRASIFF